MINGIILVHSASYKDEALDNMAIELRMSGVNVVIKEKPDLGAYAAIEWLLPTTIVACVTSGFFNEVGKDLYQLVKNKISDLTANTMKKPRIEPVIYVAGKKKITDDPFSRALSISAEAPHGRQFKLLIPKYSADIDYDKIIRSFFDFLNDFHLGVITENDIGYKTLGAFDTKIILVHYNKKTNHIEWIDHLPPHIRKKLEDDD